MATPFRAGGNTEVAGLAPMAVQSAAPVTFLADISEFEPDIADAVYLEWSHAIVIRAAYGDAHDDHAWYNGGRRSALHQGGAKFLGIYQYLVAGQDGTAQADAFHNLVGPLQKGEVLIADFEEGQHEMLTAWYNRMLNWYPAHYLWTYTGLNFGQANGALPVEWVAAYGQAEPSTPHTLWQFTSSFNVPGVGSADCSLFHGTVDQLAALAYPGGTSAPPPAPAPAPAPAAPSELRQNVKPTGALVLFTWNTVKGISSYKFQLEWWKPEFGWVLSVDIPVVGQAHTETLAAATKYRWRVSSGTWSDWSEFSTP